MDGPEWANNNSGSLIDIIINKFIQLRYYQNEEREIIIILWSAKIIQKEDNRDKGLYYGVSIYM